MAIFFHAKIKEKLRSILSAVSEVIRFSCRALLCDLDGTLIHSLAAVDRAWAKWSRQNDLAPEDILPFIHGRRSLDSIRVLAPHLDAEKEDLALRQIESTDTDGVEVIAGAAAFLASLPRDGWAIVTSGTRDVASARLRATGLPVPDVFVCGDDVSQGKPFPEPYEKAAKQLGLLPSDCVVLEDTLAGIQAGSSAGMRVLGVAALHPPIAESPVLGWIRDYTAIKIQISADGEGSLLEIEAPAYND
jgi:mannitol-1-/sugar-/sorbitol-6-phosphatase